ncbi:MAG: rod shape-determining protein MreD [Bacteroidales bacterium]|nr:rod shape-determining protein MreD [Bacteroidales bacterium]
MINTFIRYFIRFILVYLFQVLVLNNMQYSGLINPYFYIWFILVLPFETPGWLVLVSAFLLGLGIDLFPQGISGAAPSMGMHAGATVLLAFMRPMVWRWISPGDGYDPKTLPDTHFYGWIWFMSYVMMLTLIHHLALFLLEDFSFHRLHILLLRVLLSAIFTWGIIMLWEIIKPGKQRKYG